MRPGRMFVVQLHKTLHLTLMSNPASLLRKKRPETLQATILNLFRMIDVTHRADFLPQALFRFVTDLASMITVHSESGPPFYGDVQAFQQTISAHTSANSSVLFKKFGDNMRIIHA